MSRRKQGRPRHVEADPDLAAILDDGDESPTENGDAHVCGRCRAEFPDLSEFLLHKKHCAHKRVVVTYCDDSASDKDEQEDITAEFSEDGLDNNNSSVTKDLNSDLVTEDKLSSLQSEKSDADSGLTNGDLDGMDAESRSSGVSTPSPAPTLVPQSPATLPQPQVDLASLLPNSNVMLETLMNTKVAVAQFAENNLSPTDLVQMQSTLYSLQQQQILQLQLIEQLQQQLLGGLNSSFLPAALAANPVAAAATAAAAASAGPHVQHLSAHPPSLPEQPPSLPAASSTNSAVTSAGVTQNSTSTTSSKPSESAPAQTVLSTSPKSASSKPHLVTPTSDSETGKVKKSEARATSLDRTQYAAEDPFFKHKCRFCHKVFGSDSALQIHIRSHTGERPFKCNVCGNRFTTRGNLKVHFSRHKMRYPHLKMNPHPVPEHLDKPPRHIPPPAGPPPPLQKSVPTMMTDSPVPLKMEPPVQLTESPASSSSNNNVTTANHTSPPPPPPPPPSNHDESTDVTEKKSPADNLPINSLTKENETEEKIKSIQQDERATPAAEKPTKEMEKSFPQHLPQPASTATTVATATTPSVLIPGMFGGFPPVLPPFGLEPPPFFRPSILPNKEDDSMEEFMEVDKSETSKLQQLVENIEQKLSDPNECAICHRILSCKSALQMHYRIHTGERPFKCKICGRAFTTKGNLKTHMGVHRSKPPIRMMHQCPVCHKQFTNSLVLQQHIRQHTADIPMEMKAHMMPPGMEFMPGMPPHLAGFPFMPHHPMPAELDLRKPVSNKEVEEVKRLQEKDEASEAQLKKSSDGEREVPTSESGKLPDEEPMNMSSDKTLQDDKTIDTESNHDRQSPNQNEAPGDKEKEEEEEEDYYENESDIGMDEDEVDDMDDDMKSVTSSDRMTPASINQSMPIASPYMFGAPMMNLPLGVPGHFPPASMVDMAASFFNQPSVITSGFNPVHSTSLLALEERVKAITATAPSMDMTNPLQQMSNLLHRANSMSAGPRGEEGIRGFPGAENKPSSQNIATSKKEGPKEGSTLSPYMSSSDSNASLDSNTYTTDSLPTDRATPSDLLPPPFRGLGALDLSNASSSKISTTCNVCYKTFACKSALDIHYRSHTKERPYKCEVCDRCFTTRGNMKQHMLTHKIRDLPSQSFENQTSSSSSCEMPTTPSPLTTIAEEGKSDEPIAKKIKTEQISPESKNSQLSELTHEEPIKPSDLMPFTPLTTTPPSSSSLSSFALTNSSNTPAVSQGLNANSQKSQSNFSEDSSPYDKKAKHRCPLCQKNFSSASALQIHNRTHTGDRPFKCTVCGKAFTTKGNLKVHMGTHMWNNSPSRRGRRMSVDIPNMISPKDAEFFANLAQRGSSELYPFQYPQFANGLTPKKNEISVITSLNNGMNPMLMNGSAEAIQKSHLYSPVSMPEAMLKSHRSPPTPSGGHIMKQQQASPSRLSESQMKSPEKNDSLPKNGQSPNSLYHSPGRNPVPPKDVISLAETAIKSPLMNMSRHNEGNVSMPDAMPIMSPTLPSSQSIRKEVNPAPIGSNGELDLSAKRLLPTSLSSSYEPKVMNSEQLSPNWGWNTTCHLCSKVCSSVSSLEIHMKSHLPRPQNSPKPLMA